MTPKYWVTMEKTISYSLTIEADSETQAEQIADETPIEDWHEEHDVFSGIEIEEVN